MRVLVCGGRDFTNTKLVYKTLDDLMKISLIDVIIEGDARGPDRMAGFWARKNKVDLLIFKADWDKYGRSAGMIRNNQMLKDGKPDLVIAFPGGNGTRNMIELAKKFGVEVIKIES